MENIEEILVRCNMCEWVGKEDELIPLELEEGIEDCCPKCRTENYLMDLNTGELITRYTSNKK